MTDKKPALGADIFALPNQRKAHEHEIKHPGTKKGMGFFVQLQSIRSDAPQKLSKRNQADAMKRARKNDPFTPEQLRKNEIEIIGACVIGWRFGPDADGNQGNAGGVELEFNPVNLQRVLEVDEIREQLSDEINDEANFY